MNEKQYAPDGDDMVDSADVPVVSQALTTTPATGLATSHNSTNRDFNREQLDLIKRTVAAGISDDEFALFIEVAKRSSLDPFQRQIYAVTRWDSAAKRNKMTIQTGIDGFAAIADRTGTLAGVDRPEFTYDANGHLESAIARVWKLVSGQRVPFEAEAYWDEYVQTNREGNPTRMWERMPRTMLSKCALAKAYRVGFPSQLSGLYTAEEMMQADNPTIIDATLTTPAPQAALRQSAAPASARKPAPPATPAADRDTSSGANWNPLQDIKLRQALNRLGVRRADDVRQWIATLRDGCAADGVAFTSETAIAAVERLIAEDNATRAAQEHSEHGEHSLEGLPTGAGAH